MIDISQCPTPADNRHRGTPFLNTEGHEGHEGKTEARILECAGMTALWNDATCRVGGNPESLARVNQLISHKGANYVFFFDKLENPAWLNQLNCITTFQALG
jgi:hypothetical protein